MKKLMIVAVAAMVGMMANASSVSWSFDASVNYGGTPADGLTAYFFDSAQVARNDMILALQGGTYGDYIANYGGAANQPTIYVQDEVEGYTDGFSKKDSYGNPETVTGYIVLFNTDLESVDPTWAFVSEELSGTSAGISGANLPLDFTGKMENTAVAGAWTAINAAPEPTSGLLLLLGVAGLALRRRRA